MNGIKATSSSARVSHTCVIPRNLDVHLFEMNKSQLSIDLHGNRLEEAVRETSLFLERVRRTWSSSTSTAGLNGRLMVTIITGSGSHSSHGPVLRSAIKRLLDKRGMNYSLQAGRGAYLVDALSGYDLFGPGEVKSTKVVTADQQEFRQLALLKRRRNGASMADNLGSISGRGQGIPTSSMPTHRVSTHTQIARQAAITASSHRNPLPSAATEEEQIQTAKRMSQAKSQQKTKELRHLQNMEDHDVQRAVKLSEIDQQICKNKDDEEAELLRRICDESRTVEAERKRLEHQQYESELERALLQSSNYEETQTEEYLVEQAMKLSVDTLSPEEELLQQVRHLLLLYLCKSPSHENSIGNCCFVGRRLELARLDQRRRRRNDPPSHTRVARRARRA